MARGEDTAHHPGRKVGREHPLPVLGTRVSRDHGMLDWPTPGGKNEMMSMPTPGIAHHYSGINKDNNNIILTDHGAYTSGGYIWRFGNPETGRPYPDPNKFDFDYDKEITAEDRAKAADRARQDPFW